MLHRVWMLGMAWNTASRARTTSVSARYSEKFANTDGVGRLRYRSPPILSQGRRLTDRPNNPASIDSSMSAFMASISPSSTFTVRSRLRPMPMTWVRMVEWPAMPTMLGPSGSARRWST